jgi:DNA-binding transcriptional regulator LsrR (DeoR family)
MFSVRARNRAILSLLWRTPHKGLSKSAIAKQLNIGRTSVRRLLANA